ncbi:hypothetical protein [Paenibacillus sp. YAF4_2]|uniref:hypothetical protein n=1 Tax=Paenibacillus sp. YAF4_2 TaxID=3233085 RepID=UPI003F9958B8
MSKAKKIIFSCSLTAALIVGGASAVYAQYTNQDAPDYQVITADEYLRMSHIVGEVNQGNLPVSALKEAGPVLEKHPEMITKETWAKYNALK